MTLTDREIFVYVCTSVQNALVLQDLDKETKTRILIKMIEKFCPKIKYSEWNEIFNEDEKIKDDLSWYLIGIVEKKDYMKIANKHMEKFNYNQNDYEQLAKDCNIDISKIKEVMKIE